MTAKSVLPVREMGITVARALVELKTLTDRIGKEIANLNACTVTIGGKLKGNRSIEDFKQEANASRTKISDLINRYHAIKSAIIKSNASTIVSIAGESMTVAEAIERKRSIEFKETFRNKMLSNLQECERETERINTQVKNRLDKLLESTFSKDSTKVKADEFDAVSKPFMTNNQAEILTAFDIRQTINLFNDYITHFKSECDICLSESNAQTYINV